MNTTELVAKLAETIRGVYGTTPSPCHCHVIVRSMRPPAASRQHQPPIAEGLRRLCHVNLNWPREVSTTQFEFMRLSQLATSGKLLLGRRGACGGM